MLFYTFFELKNLKFSSEDDVLKLGTKKEDKNNTDKPSKKMVEDKIES